MVSLPSITAISVSLLSLLVLLTGVTHASPSVAGSVRNDVWNSKLSESGCKDPTDGRRVHAVIENITGVSDDITSLIVNGQEGIGLISGSDIEYFHWVRVHSNSKTKSLWVSFHTDNVDWLGSDLDLTIKGSDKSVIYDGKVPLTSSDDKLALSYLAFRNNGQEAVLHIHNNDDKNSHTLTSATLNGLPITLPTTATQPVPPGGHLAFAVPVKNGGPVTTNDVWTIKLGNGLGYGGRVTGIERFVVEAWPKSDNCPLPGGNNDNANELQKIGIDSVYYDGGSFEKNCGGNLPDVIAALNGTNFHVVTDRDTAEATKPAARAAFIDAILLGDEVDGDVDSDHLFGTLKKAQEAAEKAPEVPTYMGSKTTRNVGSFTGIADIQGSDAYSAACAPTMLPVIKTLPLQYPYYYLRNARDNHAPGVFWGYSQLYSDAWSYQANANELIAQIGQVVLSGSKGLMFFQSYQEQFKQHRASDIGQVVKSIRAVGDIIREGDILGMKFSTSAKLNKEVMIEVIRSPEKLLVAIVNTNARGYSNLLCHTFIDKHWTFSKLNVKSITLDMSSAPGVNKLSNWQEVQESGLKPLKDVDISTSGSNVLLGDVDIDDRIPIRLFVADVE